MKVYFSRYSPMPEDERGELVVSRCLAYLFLAAEFLGFDDKWVVSLSYDPGMASLAVAHSYDDDSVPYHRMRIDIGPNLITESDEEILSTMLHEVLHFVLAPLSNRLMNESMIRYEIYDYGTWDGHPQKRENSSAEEVVVTQLEKSLLPQLKLVVAERLPSLQQYKGSEVVRCSQLVSSI